MPASSFLYRGYDLGIRSPIVLSRATSVACGAALPIDLEISRGVAALTAPTVTRGFFTRGSAGLLATAGAVRCLCEAGQRIVVDAPVDTPDADVERVITALALPGILWMRGDLVLHASAMILPGRHDAIIVLGKSGDGKSTIAHLLLERGARILSDDNVRLFRRNGEMWVSGMAGLLSPRIASERRDADRTMVHVPAERQAASARLGAVYLLSRGSSEQVDRLPPADALGALLANRYQPRAQHVLGRTQSLLPVWVDLAARTATYRWTRPQGRVALGEREWAALR